MRESKKRMVGRTMGNRYRLVDVGNSQLLAELSALVRQSNVLTARVLAHLVELEERMLYLELGFASLFAYCVEALGMSEGAAGRRVTAARVCRRFPMAFERVARGELHLCACGALSAPGRPRADPPFAGARSGATGGQRANFPGRSSCRRLRVASDRRRSG